MPIANTMPCNDTVQATWASSEGDTIHSAGLKNLDQSIVWVSPELADCLDCGPAQFGVPEHVLHLL